MTIKYTTTAERNYLDRSRLRFSADGRPTRKEASTTTPEAGRTLRSDISGRSLQAQCSGASASNDEIVLFLFLMVRDDPKLPYKLHRINNGSETEARK